MTKKRKKAKSKGKPSASRTLRLSERPDRNDDWLYGNSTYRKELCKELIEFVQEDGRSFVAFAAHIGVTRECLYEWARKHPEWKHAMALAKDIQQAYWEDFGHKGMRGDYSSFHQAAWIFWQKARFGMSDSGPSETEDDDLEFEYD